MSITCRNSTPADQRGMGIIAAIVILVILAGLAGFIVSVTTTQNLTLAQDINSARALQASNAGIEWGLHRWLNTYKCSSSASPHITFSDPDLRGFTTTVVATPNTIYGALTTATGNIGDTSITVASATGISANMFVKGVGIGAGAAVGSSYVSGTSIPLTVANTAAVNGGVTFGTVFCGLEATAKTTGLSAGSLGFIERQLTVVVEN